MSLSTFYTRSSGERVCIAASWRSTSTVPWLSTEMSPEVETALEQCRASGHVLFLVTGCRFETVTLGHLGELFARVVWETGAVLSRAASGETYLPFGQLDPHAAALHDQVAALRGSPAPLQNTQVDPAALASRSDT
jgi:hypothetical protein